MNDIVDLCIYIFKKYPNPLQLSKPRLVKLLYLLDWKSALDYGHQVTNIKWVFNHYGPYVEDVINALKASKYDFKVISSAHFMNPFYESDKIELITNRKPIISDSAKTILDLLILHTSKMDWNQFINLVYSTYPIRNNPKYSNLNLIKDANEIKAEKAKL